MSNTLTFTVVQPFNREKLLSEALEIARYADVNLGAETQTKNINEHKAKAIDYLQKLNEEQALFAPRLDVRRLTQKNFGEQGIEPSHALKDKMKQNHFYHVGIPITLFPKSGWSFTRLECWLGFCLEETDSHQRPVIHEIFPDDVWSDILSFQDHLNIGLDENLAFRAQVERKEGQWKNLSGEAEAKLAVNVEGGAQLVVGPFSYRIRRANVRARGQGNVEAFWRLDGSKHVDEEDIMLGVVLAVPKNRENPVDAIGELKAYHDFQALSADLSKDWKQYFIQLIKYFGPALKAFFEGGAIVPAKMEWKDITQVSS